MNRTLLLFALLVMVVGVTFAQNPYVHVGEFPDTSVFKVPGGVINGGVAVDPEGKVWIQSYGGAIDSFGTGGPYTGAIYVFNPNGTQTAFSPIKTLTGTDAVGGGTITDTLNGSGYGLARDRKTGNIFSVKWSTRLWLINYKTGAGIRRIMNPIPGYTSSLAGAASNTDGEVFLAPVLPGGAVQILNADFSQGTQIAASVGDYGRTIEVSPDGNDVYVPRFGIKKTYVYHSDNGSLGPYSLKDSVFLGGSVETIGIHPTLGYVYAAPDRRSDSTWPTDNMYYAYDPVTKTLKDSFATTAAYSATLAYPRGTAFSITGDTVYIGHFDNAADAAVHRFVRSNLVAVQKVGDPVPEGYALEQNFPNPFNPSTDIRFSIAKAGFTTLRVFDMLGRQVDQLVNKELEAGTFTARFDASKLPSGTYVYEVVSGNVRLTKKMMLLK